MSWIAYGGSAFASWCRAAGLPASLAMYASRGVVADGITFCRSQGTYRSTADGWDSITSRRSGGSKLRTSS